MCKIGKRIRFEEDVKINSLFGSVDHLVKKGDKGLIDSRGDVVVLSGKCSGKVLFERTDVYGYAHDDIATSIIERLNSNYGLCDYLSYEGIDIKDIRDDIADFLKEILK